VPVLFTLERPFKPYVFSDPNTTEQEDNPQKHLPVPHSDPIICRSNAVQDDGDCQSSQ
jgi:hypothetical protein